MEKASRLEDRTVSRRGFLSRALVGGALGLAGLVGLDNSTASAEEAQAKPNQESYKKDPRDPYVHLRQKYTYEDLKKALGKEYEELPDDKKKRLEGRWKYEVAGYTGAIYEYYLKGICENPEEFIKAIPEKGKKRFAEFRIDKLEDYKIMRFRVSYPFLTSEDFKPKQGNLTRKELRNKFLIYITESLPEKPGDFPYLFKVRKIK